MKKIEEKIEKGKNNISLSESAVESACECVGGSAYKNSESRIRMLILTFATPSLIYDMCVILRDAWSHPPSENSQ